MRIVFAFLSVVLAGRSAAPLNGQAWATHHKALRMAAVTTIATDAASTIWMLSRQGTGESNPLLGTHPSPARVVAMSAAGTAAVLWIGNRLTGWKRTVFLATITSIEASVTVTNVRIAGRHPPR